MSKLPVKDRLLRAVGGALHNWSLVELSLARLFVSLGAGGHGSIIFSSIISFDTRITICDRVIAASKLDELDREIWSKLSARLSKFYKKRHEVAHFTLGHDGSAILPFVTLETITDKSVRGLNAEQTEERAGKFAELRDAVEWFTDYAALRRTGHQERRLAALQEPPLASRLRELASRSLEERKEREQPRKG